MTLDVATGNVAEGTPKAYDASMEASAIDAGTVIPPHVAINAAFVQSGKVATGINAWSLANQNGKSLYPTVKQTPFIHEHQTHNTIHTYTHTQHTYTIHLHTQ